MNFHSVLFLDLEVSSNEKIAQIGLALDDQTLRTDSIHAAYDFIEKNLSRITHICGHNIIAFDNRFLERTPLFVLTKNIPKIDSLLVSLLLLNEKTFHKLPKHYKDEDNFQNDPLKDALLSKALLIESLHRFETLDTMLRNLLYSLTFKEESFREFFTFSNHSLENLEPLLLEKILQKNYFQTTHTNTVAEAIKNNSVELAFIVALLTPTIEIKAHPPKVLYLYPHIVSLHKKLNATLEDPNDITRFSEETFGFASFREFPRLNPSLENGSILSQKEIVQAALSGESFLAVLPTGGGKTFSFWLPALYQASKTKSLSVVISPLQALMQDHLESFQKQVANFNAVAISAFLTPLEKKNAIEQVINGEADILYIAPESLRSNTIFSILKNRVIERFIIDEAHCLSTWGHDFRHDYFYIAEFIKDLIASQPWQKHIPVSCFTATAKQDVINDITRYFQDTLSLKLQHYLARPERKNLLYDTVSVNSKEEKYVKLLELLTTHKTPALVYIPSSTKECDRIAELLNNDLAPKVCASFHSKLSSEEKQQILKDYLRNKIDVVVATTAFGMGVDKPDIQTVIHYEISDSLENYAQEAGRGARDPSLEAHCPILFDESDLDKHFASLNRSKLSDAEVNAIFRVLKRHKSNKVLLSAQEIAEQAGWDTHGEDRSWEIKVKTALLELEREGYIKRKRNQVRYYANAVAKNSIETLHKLLQTQRISKEEHRLLMQVLQSILGIGKPSAWKLDEAAMTTGLEKEKIAEALVKLKHFQIITDATDLSLVLKRQSLSSFAKIQTIENELFSTLLSHPSNTFTMRMLNESLITNGCIKENDNKTDLIKTLLKSWQTKQGFFTLMRIDRQNDLWHYEIKEIAKLKRAIAIKQEICQALLFIFSRHVSSQSVNVTLEFSVADLQKELNRPVAYIDKALLILHRLKLIELAQGRFIYYSPLQIYKTDKFKNKVRYTKEEYKKRLKSYYERKIESIHIMGEYAKKMASSPKEAVQFLSDYFTLPYQSFKKRYKLFKEELTRPMTKRKYKKIFQTLSPKQQQIVSDDTHGAILILAGPGSGKTKVLTHKIASLILQEDIKPDQFLMLTFSHSAVSEFKSRLFELLGSMSFEVDIFTFHAYALRLTSRNISQDQDQELLKKIIQNATDQIKAQTITPPFKSVLVLDEFQDINETTFAFIQALHNAQEKNMRIIAVGDDDQTILRFHGSDVSFFRRFQESFRDIEGGLQTYTLLQNYRSSPEIIAVADTLRAQLPNRLKTDPIKTVKEKTNTYVTLYEVTQKELVVATESLTHLVAKEEKNVAYLTFTNAEVTALYSQLHQNGIYANYLVDHDNFALKNLAEIYNFLQRLEALSDTNGKFGKNTLLQALEQTKEAFSTSTRLKLLEKILEQFLKQHTRFYLSILRHFIDELSFEELFEYKNVVVTTMHKAKGKEFDSVVVVVNAQTLDEDRLRLLYVAFTRAKNNLYIVTNDLALISIIKKANSQTNKTLRHIRITQTFPQTTSQTIIMDLRDMYLGVSYWQMLNNEQKPLSGSLCDFLEESDKFFLTFKGQKIEQLSKKFTKELVNHFQNGWYIDKISIEYIVYWFNKKEEIYSPHVLAKFVLKRK